VETAGADVVDPVGAALTVVRENGRVSEQPGRYQRSFAGMVGAMIVVVAGIVAFVYLQDAKRDDVEVGPQAVDYAATVRSLQSGSGTPVAYPRRLPSGWIVTNASYAADGVWSLSALTADDEFVGVRQGTGQQDADDLVRTYVDERATEGEPVELPGSMFPQWRTFDDDGGDHALVGEADGRVVLVVGSAPDDDVERFAGLLTTEPLD
jgi:hypothetical protein